MHNKQAFTIRSLTIHLVRHYGYVLLADLDQSAYSEELLSVENLYNLFNVTSLNTTMGKTSRRTTYSFENNNAFSSKG